MIEAQTISRYVDSQKRWITKFYAKRQIIMLNDYLLGKDILDIGCGAGVVEAGYRDTVRSISSCDIENQNLYGLNVDICSAENLLYPDNSYEVVTMLGVIEHLSNPQRAVSECCRVLRKRGRLIVSIPDGIGWWVLKHVFKTKNLHAYFNQKDLYRLMIGWKLVGKRPIVRGLFWIYEYEVIK
jgi:ubiquinone/menaquinone biosynthesis C-methylase UbiE